MSENKENLTWDLSPLFAGDDDPKIEEAKAAAKAATEAFVKKWKDREDYLSDPAILKEALDEYENWQRNHGYASAVGFYFFLRHSTDQNNSSLKAKNQLSHDLAVNLANKIQFFLLRIAKIPEGEQSKFLNYSDLGPYKHLLERLFAEAKHTLSEAEEKILNLKGDPAHGAWKRMTESFLAKEERDGKNLAELMSLVDSEDSAARDQAAAFLNDIFLKHLDTGEAELNAILQNKKVDDDLRGFTRPDASRHLSDDMDSEVVDAMLEAVSSRFDLSARYYELKAKLFAVPRLKYHERNISYGKLNQKYPFAESVALVGRVLERLDPKFNHIFQRFLAKRQLDVYPKKGKDDGAYCAYELLINPTYILLNHTERFRDVKTLAHEVGHGINHELNRETANALNFGTPLSTAEVASTFMEDFVLEELIATADEEMRLAIMMMRLNSEVSTIFRQVACYRFEQELHRETRAQGYLPKEKIGEVFQKHMRSYMGEAVEQSSGAENWWLYWSHIRNFFYVYSYASGLLISKAMQKAVRIDKKFIEKVKEFLSAGLSDSPKNLFAKMGIDITKPEFWREGLMEIEMLLDETEKLARKLKKI